MDATRFSQSKAQESPRAEASRMSSKLFLVVLSVLLIAAYSRPFTGQISVKPALLKQVTATEAAGPGR